MPFSKEDKALTTNL